MPSRFSIRESLPVYSEADCAGALFAAKWPDGFRCPRCDHPHYYEVASRGRPLFECRSCSRQTSLTAGTVLEGTRTPLTKWFQAIYLLQIGISAKLLAELIEVTYKTAWLINHKLRHAIGEWDNDRPLEGDLQLLGEYYGYEYHRYVGSLIVQDTLRPQPVVVGVALDEARDVVHLKMKAVDGLDTDKASQPGGQCDDDALAHFMKRHAAHGWRADQTEVLRRDHRGQKAPHAAWREAVLWLAWTFGGIGPKHLQAYLNEFCFRRLLRYGMLTELIWCCGRTKTITYRRLVGARAGIRPVRWANRRKERFDRQAG